MEINVFTKKPPRVPEIFLSSTKTLQKTKKTHRK